MYLLFLASSINAGESVNTIQEPLQNTQDLSAKEDSKDKKLGPPPLIPGITKGDSEGKKLGPPPLIPGITKEDSKDKKLGPPPLIPGITKEDSKDKKLGPPSLIPGITKGDSEGKKLGPPPLIPGITKGDSEGKKLGPPPLIPGIAKGDSEGKKLGPPPLIPGLIRSNSAPSLSPPPLLPGITKSNSSPAPNLSPVDPLLITLEKFKQNLLQLKPGSVTERVITHYATFLTEEESVDQTRPETDREFIIRFMKETFGDESIINGPKLKQVIETFFSADIKDLLDSNLPYSTSVYFKSLADKYSFFKIVNQKEEATSKHEARPQFRVLYLQKNSQIETQKKLLQGLELEEKKILSEKAELEKNESNKAALEAKDKLLANNKTTQKQAQETLSGLPPITEEKVDLIDTFKVAMMKVISKIKSEDLKKKNYQEKISQIIKEPFFADKVYTLQQKLNGSVKSVDDIIKESLDLRKSLKSVTQDLSDPKKFSPKEVEKKLENYTSRLLDNILKYCISSQKTFEDFETEISKAELTDFVFHNSKKEPITKAQYWDNLLSQKCVEAAGSLYNTQKKYTENDIKQESIKIINNLPDEIKDTSDEFKKKISNKILKELFMKTVTSELSLRLSYGGILRNLQNIVQAIKNLFFKNITYISQEQFQEKIKNFLIGLVLLDHEQVKIFRDLYRSNIGKSKEIESALSTIDLFAETVNHVFLDDPNDKKNEGNFTNKEGKLINFKQFPVEWTLDVIFSEIISQELGGLKAKK